MTNFILVDEDGNACPTGRDDYKSDNWKSFIYGVSKIQDGYKRKKIREAIENILDEPTG